MRNRLKLKQNPFQESLVYKTIEKFYFYYLYERNVEKTLSMLSENVYSVGTGEGEIAWKKSELRILLEKEITTLQNPIYYEIDNYVEKQRVEGCWDCFFNINLRVITKEGIRVRYYMRNTVGVHLENGKYVIDVLHASEASIHQDDGEFFPLKYVSNGVGIVNPKIKDDILEIVIQIIPGGVVGGYDEEGFPIYAANEQFLKMAGYQGFNEFKKDINGLIINSIHPDDQKYVIQTLKQNFEYCDQYQVQYRMKKKDGTYLWVQDIGKKTMDGQGRTAIISVITDISEQMVTRRKIEREISRDPLTGIYNRRSGEKRISKRLADPCEYIFFMLDLDNFKRVNDIYGHAQGDETLRWFAKMASDSFRSADTVCRMGGDEFVIFVYGTSNIPVIQKKIERLIEDYRVMMEERCPKAHATISAGGVCSDKAFDFIELYKKADRILYEVKNQKKGWVKICII